MLQKILYFFKKMLIGVLSLALLLVLIGFLFVTFSPQFGGKPSQDQMAEYSKLPYFSDGKFSNLIETEMTMSTGKAIRMLPQFFKNDPARKPDFALPTVERDSLELVSGQSKDRLIWFGHSAFLLQLDGKTILIDPMLSEVPAPHPWLGKPRFSEELPIPVEKLPEIDFILISHDHYDHLDYESIQKLKSKTKHFLVPLGVGAHFERWGVEPSRIQELRWWEETDLLGLHFAFAPSRHFSGRGISNRFSTLWGSWILQSEKHKLYFSGDGGYGPHFKEIGEKYGPFDFAMLECGQYNENWSQLHMAPEQTALAAMDLGAKVGMPIHWGAFSLAMHSWTDPVERVRAKASELELPLAIPKIGEFVYLDAVPGSVEEWWKGPR
ncbi:MBL fold metallo-hydrolase [Algoriphagus namhaensis]